jgi:DNA-binding NarL/FixJ family response regulator
MIKILLVDDHTIFRIGLIKIIQKYSDFQVIFDTDNAQLALEKIDSLKPDILLTDIQLPDIQGVDLIKMARRSFPALKTAVLSMFKDADQIVAAIEAGSNGYFSKEVIEQNLIEGLRKIKNGETYYSPEVSQEVIQALIHRQDKNQNNHLNLLTDREIEVIKLICEGLNNHEISAKLYISPKTFDNHRANILRKLKLKNNVQLCKFALDNKIV